MCPSLQTEPRTLGVGGELSLIVVIHAGFFVPIVRIIQVNFEIQMGTFILQPQSHVLDLNTVCTR